MEIKSYEKRANYYETDQMGVVHHSNYIRWFEEARVDMMRQIDLDYKKCEDIGVMMPVLEVECKYKSSVRFDEVVDIITKVSEFNGVRMTLEYEARDKKSGEIRAVGTSRHCFLNKGFKPIRLKKEYPEIYNKIISVMEKKEE